MMKTMSNSKYKRGDIYFVEYIPGIGSEQTSGRPAVIVSNEKCNEYSPVVEMVYLTTAEKRYLPTHVRINSTKYPSTALCQQIVSIDKSRLEKYCGCCTQQEMQQIDQALLDSLGLVSADKQGEPVSEQARRAPTATGRLGRCERSGAGPRGHGPPGAVRETGNCGL